MTAEEILKKHLNVHVELSVYPHGYPYILEAMREYAKQTSIEFKECQDYNLEDKKWENYDGHDTWINPHTREVKSTSELFELFLKQK